MKWQVSRIWSGVCWVIGGGGSIAKQFGIQSEIAPETIEEFYEFGDYLKAIHNDHVIGVNLAAFLGDWVDVAFWGDTDTYNQYKGYYDDFSGLKVSCSPKFMNNDIISVKHLHRDIKGGISSDPGKVSWEHAEVKEDDKMKTINAGNSGAAAINLAYHLGCTEIRLLGFDMVNDPYSGRIHFHTGYPQKDYNLTNEMVKYGNVKVPREPRKSAPYYKHILSFEKIAEDAKKLGIKIINVNPDSAIHCFEKVSLNEILNENDNIQINNNKNGFCICGHNLEEQDDIHNIPILKCTNKECNIIKQKTDVNLINYYKHDYHTNVYTHSYSEDTIIAKERLKKYKTFILNKGKSIDVGSGNHAFVDEARRQDLQCYGVEISESSKDCEFIYNKELKENHFPTDYFQNVFVHDVLEHLEKPKDFLKELNRIVKQEGNFILEFPDFWTEGGKRHWKDVEHIWFFNTEQLIRLIEGVGFSILNIYHPIADKITIICKKQKENRVKILVPPGIGDIHWVLIKLQSFMLQNNISLPDVYISSFGKRDRSLEYLKMFPFLNAKDYKICHKDVIPWKEAYRKAGRTIFNSVEGCDYFIAFNGQMREPLTLDEINPELKCNYDLPMFESWEEKEYGKNFLNKHGNYIVAYFIDSGMYGKRWLNIFTEEDIIESLKRIVKGTDLKIVLVGAGWDNNSKPVKMIRNSFDDNILVNMVSKTNIEELFAIIKNSVGVIGFPSGITILSTFFKKPTYMFWSNYFNNVFWYATCHPETVNKTYKYIDVKDATPKIVTNEFRKLISVKTNYAVCVLRSGGDFTEEYVYKMKSMLKRNINVPFEFRCFTDMDLDLPSEEIIKLKHNWPGWWSKLEIFRNDVYQNNYRVVYFDLDTLITDNIDSLFSDISDFRMLKGFSALKPSDASGVMLFTEDLSYIYKALCKNENQMETNGKLNWDQHFISKQYIKKAQKRPFTIQGIVNVQSYKRHLKNGKKNGEINEITSPIVCFHGKPRPHEVKNETIKDIWK